MGIPTTILTPTLTLGVTLTLVLETPDFELYSRWVPLLCVYAAVLCQLQSYEEL